MAQWTICRRATSVPSSTPGTLSSKNSEFRFNPQTQQLTLLDLGSRYGTAKLVTETKQIPEGALEGSSSYWV